MKQQLGKNSAIPPTIPATILHCWHQDEIEVPNVAIYEENTIEIPLSIRNASNIFSLKGEISYDPALLDFQNIDWAPGFDDYIKIVRIEGGKCQFVGSRQQTDTQRCDH